MSSKDCSCGDGLDHFDVFFLYISFFFEGFVETAECAGPGGTDSGASTSCPEPQFDWEIALSLPDDHGAPLPLQKRVKDELYLLVNIGRKNTLGEAQFSHFLEPLSPSVAFCRKLLSRIEHLKTEHYNGGNHLLFSIKNIKIRSTL